MGPTASTSVACAALFVLAGLAPSAAAQVNAEVLRPDRLSEGFGAQLEASFALARGNVELLDLGGAATVRYQTLHPPAGDPNAPPDPEAPPPFVAQQAFVTANARVAESAGEVVVDEGFAHARWTAMWLPRVGSEVFAQYQYNEFQRLLDRAVTGTGVRVDAVHARELMLWGGSGYMFEYNRIDVLPGATDDPETYEHRWTNYLALSLAPAGDALTVRNIVYFQPRFDAFDDFRLLDELELMANVGETFSLGTSLTLFHDSAPPTAVQRTDLRLASKVRVSL